MSEMPPPPPPPSMPAGQPASSKPPRDFMTVAIIATIVGLCTSCIGLVTGIIAIVFSNKARQAWAAGDVNGYESASNTAKILVIVTFALAALGLIINAIAVATGSWTFTTS